MKKYIAIIAFLVCACIYVIVAPFNPFIFYPIGAVALIVGGSSIYYLIKSRE